MKKTKRPCRVLLIFLFLPLFQSAVFSQETIFTLQDTLRGSITPERAWWDLTYYHLNLEAFPEDSTIKGEVAVHFKTIDPGSVMQIDLQPPMHITSVVYRNDSVPTSRLGNVYYLEFPEKFERGERESVRIEFAGKPVASKMPPWDGGLVWRRDDNGNPFIATACQGEGASLWWPCKDHMYDEPDSMRISITVPRELTGVANGRLEKIEKNRKEKSRTFHWFVSNPISNYVINMNIADYVHFSEQYPGENGPLDCDYYVLSYNLDTAKVHFKQVPMMLEAFEYWFGPYPFYEDGYKLVEVPYAGMEHQSSVTYGNRYANGFMGMDVSHSGWGDKFDFIIIHESGHEWFANNITYRDIADMWVHEGFTAYSESLYTEYHFGKEAGYEYVRGTRANIHNDRTIIGQYDVNHAGSGDMYPKAANMLHTIRQLVDNDSTWRSLLRGLNETFYHQTVTTQQIERYMAEFTGLELGAIFDQYLRDVRIPVLEYGFQEGRLKYRWNNCVDDFAMPVKAVIDGKQVWLLPTSRWTFRKLDSTPDRIAVDPNFYVAVLKI